MFYFVFIVVVIPIPLASSFRQTEKSGVDPATRIAADGLDTDGRDQLYGIQCIAHFSLANSRSKPFCKGTKQFRYCKDFFGFLAGRALYPSDLQHRPCFRFNIFYNSDTAWRTARHNAPAADTHTDGPHPDPSADRRVPPDMTAKTSYVAHDINLSTPDQRLLGQGLIKGRQGEE